MLNILKTRLLKLNTCVILLKEIKLINSEVTKHIEWPKCHCFSKISKINMEIIEKCYFFQCNI